MVGAEVYVGGLFLGAFIGEPCIGSLPSRRVASFGGRISPGQLSIPAQGPASEAGVGVEACTSVTASAEPDVFDSSPLGKSSGSLSSASRAKV